MRKFFIFVFWLLLFGGFLASIFFLPGETINIEAPGVIFSFLKPKPKEKEITLIFVGDIMLSRNVDRKMEENQDYRYPFFKTAQILKSIDITFGNLECPITPGRDIQTGEMIFRGDPESLEGLQYAGFDILSLANNHTPNFGQEGLKDTFKYLSRVGILYVGAGENGEEAHEPKILEKKGTSISFLAYNDSDVVPASYEASSNRAGTALMNIEKMRKDIKKAKTKSDFLILSMHSGTEYAQNPNQRQIDFAHAAIDAGADLVVGHHPHVIQRIEKYKEKYIFYSLGNFVFDQMWSQKTREGLIAKVTLKFLEGENNFNVETKFYKVLIENFSQPRILGEYYP